MTASELYADYWKRVGDRQVEEIAAPCTVGEQLIYSVQQKYAMRQIERDEFIKTIGADRRVQQKQARAVSA